MECTEIVFSGHALDRMFDRSITPREVRGVVETGETIEEYPEDRPYPSRLLLATIGGRVLHAVVARDEQSRRCYVVTAYPPDPQLWSEDYRTRRR